MRVVEVHVSITILGDTFSAMRRWLDHNHCTPVSFDYISDPPEKVIIEVAFDEHDLAEKFQQEFEQAEWISTGAHGRRAARATGRASQAGRDGRGGDVKESDDERSEAAEVDAGN